MSVTDEDIKARLLERTRGMLDALVDEVMTTDVVTVDYNDFVSKPARLILENGFMGVLVMKEGKPFTIVTQFDLLSLAYEEVFDPDRDFLRLTVGELLKDKPLVSVPTGTRIREAMNIMLDRNMRAMPVIDEGRVRGIFSTGEK